MEYLKYSSILAFVFAIASSSNVEQPKRDTLLKLEIIETPLLEALRSNASERISQNNDNQRGSDVLLQILGLKQSTTTRHPHYPGPPPWHTTKPTYKPHPTPHPPPHPHPHPPPHPHPHPPSHHYPPYPYSPYYPYYPYYYPYWAYPPYGYPPRPPGPPPTRPPTPPTPPTPGPPTPNPNPPEVPPSPGNEPGVPTMEDDPQDDPVHYQFRTDNFDDNDDEENDSSESVLKLHKKKTGLNRYPAGRPHIIRINTNDAINSRSAESQQPVTKRKHNKHAN